MVKAPHSSIFRPTWIRAIWKDTFKRLRYLSYIYFHSEHAWVSFYELFGRVKQASSTKAQVSCENSFWDIRNIYLMINWLLSKVATSQSPISSSIIFHIFLLLDIFLFNLLMGRMSWTSDKFDRLCSQYNIRISMRCTSAVYLYWKISYTPMCLWFSVSHRTDLQGKPCVQHV